MKRAMKVTAIIAAILVSVASIVYLHEKASVYLDARRAVQIEKTSQRARIDQLAEIQRASQAQYQCPDSFKFLDDGNGGVVAAGFSPTGPDTDKGNYVGQWLVKCDYGRTVENPK